MCTIRQRSRGMSNKAYSRGRNGKVPQLLDIASIDMTRPEMVERCGQNDLVVLYRGKDGAEARTFAAIEEDHQRPLGSRARRDNGGIHLVPAGSRLSRPAGDVAGPRREIGR